MKAARTLEPATYPSPSGEFVYVDCNSAIRHAAHARNRNGDMTIEFLAMVEGKWHALYTADVDAFLQATDKGAAIVNRRGRPRKVDALLTTIGIRLHPSQHAWIKASADFKCMGEAQFIRAALVKSGMPDVEIK